MINESKMNKNALKYLRKKVASSIQDLEILYLMKRKSLSKEMHKIK